MTATILRRGVRDSSPVRVDRRPSVDPGLRRLTSAGFDVVVHEGTHRTAWVVPGAERLCVVVADEGPAAPLADDLPALAATSSTTLWAHADGRLFVRASWAPPALLVRGGQVTMLPQIPGTTGEARLHGGDRVVVLSSAAYESAPQQIVRLLHDDPPGLARVDAGSLLGALLGAVPGGGGVVLTRRAETDHEETSS
ncbi:MAG: hypothetical protein ABI083_04585 [Lapillicoccus sp.]